MSHYWGTRIIYTDYNKFLGGGVIKDSAHLNNIASNGRMNNEFERIWKEAVVALIEGYLNIFLEVQTNVNVKVSLYLTKH
jgi:hypothetical protein